MEEADPGQPARKFLGGSFAYMHAIKEDKGFASEIAYVIMTLHMHGA